LNTHHIIIKLSERIVTIIETNLPEANDEMVSLAKPTDSSLSARTAGPSSDD
jgi:hypothetical protein